MEKSKIVRDNNVTITIPLAEYKELLKTRGRYEELKEQISIETISYKELGSDEEKTIPIDKLMCNCMEERPEKGWTIDEMMR